MAYCRIDELTPEEEPILEGMYYDAAAYMLQAGIAEPEEGTPRRAQYELCINRLVLDAWDCRGTSAEERLSASIMENRAFRRTINQMKLTEPVSKLDT